jgi:hypothetical protein
MARMTLAGESGGVLVVRAWLDGDPPQLKARITHILHVPDPEPETATVSSAPAIHAELDRWLEALKENSAR